MATKRRKRRSTKRRNPVARKASAPRAANPRRRRRRRRNPAALMAARPAARRAVNPSRRRRRRNGFARRGNPTAMRIGEIFKDMIYGAGGAVLTRAISSAVQGFIPGQFAGNPLAGPVVQIVVSVTAVRYGVRKFVGQKQADIAMLGGLISAGLQLADIYLPNAQSSITNILRAPVIVAPQAQLPSATAASALAGYRHGGMGDVYDVPINSPAFRGLSGLGDVEDVPLGIWA